MYGDILYIERRPALWHSIDERSNEDTRLIDRLIYRLGVYRHYGIEVENGYVIHFHSNAYHKRKEAIIKRVTRDEFRLGGQVSVLDYVGPRFCRQETVNRAYSALGIATMPYSINKNNCEHFAMWCATGAYHSRQSYIFDKGQDVLMLPTKVPGKVIKTKDWTIEHGVNLYNRILHRA